MITIREEIFRCGALPGAWKECRMRGSIRTRKDDRCLDVFFHIRVDEAKWYPVNFGGVVTVLCDTKNQNYLPTKINQVGFKG